MNQEITAKEYRKIHGWLHRNYGDANHCDNPKCDSLGTIFETYDWAVIHEKGYAYNISHFMQLCRRCHKRYDISQKENKIIITPSYNSKAIIRQIIIYEEKLKERGSNMNPKTKIKIIEKIKKLKEEL